MTIAFAADHAQCITDALLEELDAAPLDLPWSEDLRRRVRNALSPVEIAAQSLAAGSEVQSRGAARHIRAGIASAKSFLAD